MEPVLLKNFVSNSKIYERITVEEFCSYQTTQFLIECVQTSVQRIARLSTQTRLPLLCYQINITKSLKQFYTLRFI